MTLFHVTVLALLLVLLAGCGGPAEEATTSLYDFVDVAEDAGLDFRHTSGAAGDWFLVETMGSGAAFVDYDRDGWLDVYLADGFDLAPWRGKLNPINQMAVDSTGYWVSVEYEPPLRYSGGVDSTVYMLRQDPAATLNRLYRNGGGIFAPVQAGAADPGYGMGVAVGDYDNDGWADIYVTNYGPNALYRNEAGRYTAAVGLDDPRWSASAAFFDYDNDGDLDLYVVNYLDMSPRNNRLCGGAVSRAKSTAGALLRIPDEQRTYCAPRRYNGAPDALFRNDETAFADVTRASGVYSPFGKGLGIAAVDFDADGDQDLYVANDGTRNFLYRNNGAGAFQDVALGQGAAYNADGQAESGMGVAVGDIDGDRDADLLVTNFSRETNTLYRNEGNLSFADITEAAGLRESSLLPLGFGAFFFDADSDADLDLFIANGHVLDKIEIQEEDLSYAQPNQLFANDGRGEFRDVSAAAGPAFMLTGVSRGAAAADYDNDGDLDVLLTNVDGPARLYRNDSPPGNNWLSLRLRGTRSNRDAVGARVDIWCDGVVQTRWRIGGGTYLSAGDHRLFFGLGDCGLVEKIEIAWPNGGREELNDVEPNQFLTVKQES